MERWLAILVFLCAPCWAGERDVTDKQLGLAWTLPADGWTRRDLGQAGVVVRLYAPPGGMLPRVTLMRFPKAFLPAGLETRKAQIERVPGVKAVRFEAAMLAGREGHVYEYTAQGARSVEHGFAHGDVYLVVQAAARETAWQDSEQAAAFRSFFESVRLLDTPPPKPTLQVDRKSPAEVRAARAATRPRDWPFAIRNHDLRLDVWPAKRRLVVRDHLTVEALADRVEALDLILTHVDVKGFEHAGKQLAFQRKNERIVTVTLDEPLTKGQTRVLSFHGEGAPFSYSLDQKLVQEIAMLGQVGERSSFSSHVFYYPCDPTNDAPLRMEIVVPAGYTAVSGGDFQGRREHDARHGFRYRFENRSPRLLPLGFAVGKYAETRTKTPDGLELVFYHPRDKAKEARQRLEVALASGTLFERLMGPLPWKRVAFCHVVPERKEMGVSLPGLVLISEGFFQDLEGFELSGAKLNDPEGLGLLLTADELSHQWNAYAVSLPNELAEGISTFTNLLYIEAEKGRADYRKGLEFCAQAYMATARTTEDVAIADPKLYRSDIYRVAAFCKGAVVLDLLRQRLGDETFFAAWRKAFTSLRGVKSDYEEFERALSEGAEVDLRAFFDQWFLQAGYPHVEIEWSTDAAPGAHTLTISLAQVQPGGVFTLRVPVEVSFAGAAPTQRVDVALSERKKTVSLVMPHAVTGVRVDPDGANLLLQSSVAQKLK